MGACYDEFICKADNDHEAMVKCEDYIAECELEYGHSPYSGTMATCHGAVVTGMKFEHHTDAYVWLEGNTEKRGAALGVKVQNDEQGTYYVFGAMCGS